MINHSTAYQKRQKAEKKKKKNTKDSLVSSVLPKEQDFVHYVQFLSTLNLLLSLTLVRLRSAICDITDSHTA